MPRSNFKYIIVEGVIGAGKTSLTSMLSEWYCAHLVLEEFESNPFLEDFYKDKNAYAFQTQIFFLLSRFKQQKNIRQYDLFQSKIISDYMFQKDRLFATMNLSKAEMKLYDALAKIMEQQLIAPDFIVYLKGSTTRLMHNIRKRGREMELNMSAKYIGALNDLYNDFFYNHLTIPFVTVNLDEVDFVNSQKDFKNILDQINKQAENLK